jgi:Domain of unknown function (DUF4351)
MTEYQDHDQRFKAMIREFFADFLRLFFADWAARFDLDHIEWLDKEVLPDPPDGLRHLLDLVAKLRTKEPAAGHDPGAPETWLALVHIEIESPEKTTLLKPRLPGYYVHLWEQHGLPVLPIVLYLKVGLDGVGTDTVEHRFWELPVLTFRYLYVGLPGLDAVQYVQGDNWLGVALAALMRIPPGTAERLGAEALRRLSQAPLSDQQRYLLSDCVNYYLPLDAAGRALFERILQGEEYAGVQAMNKTPYDKGVEAGQVRVVTRTLERKFGPLPAEARDRLAQLALDELTELTLRLGTAGSLADLGLTGETVAGG